MLSSFNEWKFIVICLRIANKIFGLRGAKWIFSCNNTPGKWLLSLTCTSMLLVEKQGVII
uniref:Uncharacterized protein n=1 Tax=Rhizophora mucronata TaxID=61149 RepID=A0A2P2N8Q7_RHIMU